MDSDPDCIVNQRSERRGLGESVQVDRIGASEHVSIIGQSRERAVGGEQTDSDGGKDGVCDEEKDQKHRRNKENETKGCLRCPGARLVWARLPLATQEATKERGHSSEPQSSHYVGTFA